VIFHVVRTTCFYSMSEVHIHAWFRSTATCGSQHGYKYDHAWVGKAVLVHACVVLITRGVLYQWRMSIQSLLHGRVLRITTTSTSTKHTCDIYIVTIMCCNACTLTHTWLEPTLKWRVWLTLDYARSQMRGFNHSTASEGLGFKTYSLWHTYGLINHSCSHGWLEPLVSTGDTGGFKPCVDSNQL